MEKALGFIEAKGYTGVVEATDKMPKTSEVTYFHLESIGGGFVTVVYSGEVGAVKSAVENACYHAGNSGTVHSQNVIPRPSPDLYDFIKKAKEKEIDISGYNALGMVEMRGFAPMVEAADAGLKAADVIAAYWQTIGGGHTTVFFRGEVAAVASAVENAVLSAEKVGELIASHVIPRPHYDINLKFPVGKIKENNKKSKSFEEGDALGVVETRSLVSIINAADAGLKSANVACAGWYKVGSALVSTIFRGDVAAVRTSIKAAENAAKSVGNFVSSLVIPKPYGSVENLV